MEPEPLLPSNICHFYVVSGAVLAAALFVCLFAWPVARTSAKGVALSVLVAFFGAATRILMVKSRVPDPSEEGRSAGKGIPNAEHR